jgi:riboflavin synthase
MFTGVIRHRGVVLSSELKGQKRIVHIETPKGWNLSLGESISVNGICTTVRTIEQGSFGLEYMPATRKFTTADEFTIGRKLHLERSLRMNDALDGHFVQGHIDASGIVTAVLKNGDSYRVTIRLPATVRRLLIPWGSVTVDGVSLTIQELGRATFTVALISHTLEETSLGELRKGSRINIETDMFARYVAHILKK